MITLGNFLLNNLCFPMGCFATDHDNNDTDDDDDIPVGHT